MPIFDGNLPYTNFHELNLDWIISYVKSVKAKTDLIEESVLRAEERSEQAKFYAESIKDIILTPEMFGAIGDLIADDTDAIQEMFNNANGKLCVMSKKYKVTSLIINNLENAIILGGIIESPSDPVRRTLIKLRQCKNVVFSDLTLKSTNDQTAYNISGFTPLINAVSSNLIGILMEKCQYITFNNLTETNMLIGIWLTKGTYDSYTNTGNKEIQFNNLIQNGIFEGMHSDESNGVNINNMIFDNTDLAVNPGYHGFYFERNSTKLYVNNLNADWSETSIYAFFDFADFGVWDAQLFKQEVLIENSYAYAPVLFTFNSRNKMMKAVNCEFKLKPFLQAGGTYDTVLRFIDVANTDKNSGKYPTIIFENCSLLPDENITTSYLTRSTEYAKYYLENCDTKFRINTANVDATFKGCHITEILLFIFSTTAGTVKLIDCVWDALYNSYVLASRSATMDFKVYNSIINVGNHPFINNGGTASDMTFYNTIFHSVGNVGAFQVDNGTGVTPINCYWNDALIV